MNFLASAKFRWYLLLTAVGLMHAEVLSWSSPLVLLNPLVFWYVAPVYAVHYIVFGDMILRSGRSNFWVLYVFGCLTGMYEFAITKVYWATPWSPWAPPVLGVYWVEMFMIGFVWHAFMSFIMPFRLMQDYVLPGRTQPGTARDVKILMVLIPLVQGAFGLLVHGNVLFTLGAVLGSLAIVNGTVWLFTKAAAKAEVTHVEDLVLSPRGRRRAWKFLIAVYVGYGVAVNPQNIGLGVGLIIPLAFYAALIAGAYVLVKLPAPSLAAPAAQAAPPAVPTMAAWNRFAVRYGAHFTVAFLGMAAIQMVAPWLVMVIALSLVGGGLVVSLYFFPRLFLEVRKAWRASKVPAAPAPPTVA